MGSGRPAATVTAPERGPSRGSTDPGRAASRVRASRRVTFGRTTFSGSTGVGNAARCSHHQSRSKLPQPLATATIVRHRLRNDPPVVGPMVAHAEVCELVGDDVVDERRRRQDCAPAEAKRAVRRAAGPPLRRKKGPHTRTLRDEDTALRRPRLPGAVWRPAPARSVSRSRARPRPPLGAVVPAPIRCPRKP